MKRTITLLVAALFLAASVWAAEEEGGLIPRLFHKLFKRPKAAEPVAMPAKTATQIPGEAPKAATEETMKQIPESAVKEPAATQTARIEMTPIMMAERIAETLLHEDEILNFIPGLKKEKVSDGKDFYTYQGVKIDELDKEKLQELYNKVNNEAVRIRTERLNRQLESINQAHQATIAAQQALRVPRPVAPPPQPPPTNPTVVQPPKPPPMPPVPPRR